MLIVTLCPLTKIVLFAESDVLDVGKTFFKKDILTNWSKIYSASNLRAGGLQLVCLSPPLITLDGTLTAHQDPVFLLC